MKFSPRARKAWVVAAVGVFALALWGGLKLLGPRVEVVEVRSGPLVQLEAMSGRVRAPRTTTLSAQVAGRVLQVPVEEGSRSPAGHAA